MKTSHPSKSRKTKTVQSPALNAMDAVHDHFARIETLAGLLCAAGDPDTLDSRLAADAGFHIADEARRAKALLKNLETQR